jgi:hypothetical protein
MHSKYYAFIILIVLLISCNSEINDAPVKTMLQIDTTIADYQNFYYDLGPLKDNGEIGISIKSTHSEICEVFADTTTRAIIFKYKAEEDYDGKDFVELYRSSSQEKRDTIRVNFTIKNTL